MTTPSRFCTSCGTEVAGARFCTGCGATLGGAPPPVTATAVAPVRPAAQGETLVPRSDAPQAPPAPWFPPEHADGSWQETAAEPRAGLGTGPFAAVVLMVMILAAGAAFLITSTLLG